jgi:hypothetical protein
MSANKHGLSRDIPSEVKRVVRQNSCFGCVLCRSAVYTYEHIEPSFVDAKFHDPSRIALLCPTCHALVTKGRIPKEHISSKYSSIQSSSSVQRPSDQEFFAHYGNSLTVRLGSSEFQEFRSIINIDGVDVLSYNKSSETGAYVVTGIFYDRLGKELFRIVENEWIGPIDAWDVEQVGRRLTIRSSPKNVVFEAMKDNDKSELNITRLDMFFAPFHVAIDSGSLLVGQYDENGNQSIYFAIDGIFRYGDCALYLDSNRVSQLKPSGMKMVGGKGAWIEGTGIWMGFGSSQALLHRIRIYNNGCEVVAKEAIKKSIEPSAGQNYFVLGSLDIQVIEHPLWTEEEYSINGQKLTSKPFSWGKVDEYDGKSIELFHITRSEPEDLAINSGFIGFYADDVLALEWSDKVFEVEVEEHSEDGAYVRRVKQSDVGGRRIVNAINPETGKPFHPQEFAGTCPWKDVDPYQ